MSDPTDIQLGVDAAPVVTAGEQLAAGIIKLIDDLATNPTILAWRQNAGVQAALDKITADANAALKPGADLTQVENDLSK